VTCRASHSAVGCRVTSNHSSCRLPWPRTKNANKRSKVVQGGILRLKHPSERRPGLPREHAFIFWPRFVWETLSKHAVIIGMIARLLLLKFAIMRDPAARTYMDVALAPASGDEDMTLDLLTNTTGARAAVAHLKKVAGLTGTARPAILDRDGATVDPAKFA
jgi:hypothetical protein